MRALTPRSRLHGEQGASMALILALIAILGLCVGGIAVQGTAGMMAVKGVSNQRSDVYGAESAIDGAINHIRDDLALGRPDTTSCPTTGPATIFTAPSDAGPVTVTCKSLATGVNEIEGLNFPENAILTTSGLPGYPNPVPNNSCNGDPGICLTGASGGIMKVQGTVKSNATSASGASIEASGSTKLDASEDAVRATGTCTGNIVAKPLKCGTGITRLDPGGPATSDVTNPANSWAAEMLTMPPVAPAPTCNATSKVATMQPGSYFDRDAVLVGFTAVVSGVRKSCPVVWMKPGNYYFDYSQSTDGDPWRIGYDDAFHTDGLYPEDFGSSTDVPGSVIIGGTLSGAINPNAGTSQVSAARAAVHLGLNNNNPAVPGGCDRTSPNGVQVMMANYVAFDVKDQGMLELCPSPASSKQQIVLYGRKTDQGPTAATSLFRPTGVSGAVPASFGTPLANLVSIGDGLTTTGMQTGSNKTNSVTLTGYGPTVGVPPVSSFTNAVLTVRHSEVTLPANAATIKVTVTPGGGAAACPANTTTFTRQTVLTSQTWTIPTTCIDSIADLTGATVKWEVNNPNSSGTPSVTSTLDGAELTANYQAQGLQAKAAGSKIVWMYGDYGDHTPEIYLWGTVYAPTSRIELGLFGVATTVARFGRGVVLAGLNVANLTVNQPYVAFGNANGVAHYQDRQVELIATIGGTRQLRVVVQFDDSTDPNTPGKIVKIISWNAVN
jgi:hypothetical protein